MLTFKPTTSGYIVEYNAEYLGELARDASGYFVFWPEMRAGYWGEYVLRDIAAKMNELNAEWHKQVVTGIVSYLNNDPSVV